LGNEPVMVMTQSSSSVLLWMSVLLLPLLTALRSRRPR